MRTIDVRVYGTDTIGNPVKSVWTDYQVDYDEEDDGKIKGVWCQDDIIDLFLDPDYRVYTFKEIVKYVWEVERERKEELDKEDQGQIIDAAYDRWRDEA